MDYKIAICGKKEEVLAFRGLGMETIFVDDSLDAEKKILDVKKNQTEFAIIFITEDLFQDFSEDGMAKITEGALPAIVPLPGHKGATGFGDERMKKFVEQAVGSDIFADS